MGRRWVFLSIFLMLLGIWATLTFQHRKKEITGMATIAEHDVPTKKYFDQKNQESEMFIEETYLEKDKESQEIREKLTVEGWKYVDEKAADSDVVNLNPALLPNREEEIQTQMQTNGYAGEGLDRVYAIASATKNSKTRTVAIETLGRSMEFHAQELLVRLYKLLNDEKDREQILSFIKPSKPSDAVSQFLIEQINNSNTSESIQEQASMALIHMLYAQNIIQPFKEESGTPEDEDRLLEEMAGRMSSRLNRDKFLEMANKIRTGELLSQGEGH